MNNDDGKSIASRRTNVAINGAVQYPEVNTIYLLLFCGYVFIWYVDLVGRSDFFASIRIEFLYAGALSVISLFVIPKDSIDHPLKTITIILFIVTAIQVPISRDYTTSKIVFIDRFVKFSFMAWFIGAFVRSPKSMMVFFLFFFLACMKLGQEGLIGQITGSLSWENQGVMRLHGPTPKYGHPNSFTGMALGTVPFIFSYFPLASKKIKLALAIALIFAMNIVIFTGSRTGYVAFCVLLFAYIWKSRNKIKYLFMIAVLVLSIIPFIPEQYEGRFMSIFSGEDKEGQSTELRKEILRDAVNIFVSNPLGIGVGAFPAVRWEAFKRSQDTHNLYLEVATNLGIQGLIVFFIFIYKMLKILHGLENRFKKIIKELTNRQTNEQQNGIKIKIIDDAHFLQATSHAVFLFIVVRLGLGLFGMDLYEIYWWFALGLTGSLYRICIRMEKHFSSAIISTAMSAKETQPADFG
jgi:O-antigen ligase